MKLVSRAQWGARDYRRPNGAIQYSRARRGVKLHYLGSAYSDRAHTRCAAYVRHIQAVHMDGRGWSDIGYSFVVCTHGWVYEGRGLTRRNSANGNTALNEQDYAVLLLVGSSGHTKPAVEQLEGARDAIEYCRSEGPAGSWVGGHRDGYATECPGDAVYAWIQRGAPRPDTKEDDVALTDEDLDKIARRVWGHMADNVLSDDPAKVSMERRDWGNTARLARVERIAKQVLVQGAARDVVLAKLAEGGGLTVEQIEAAAAAGARAALAELGDALQGEG